MNPQGQSQTTRRKLGEILVAAGVVDELQIGTALGHQRQWGGRLGNILIDLHFIDDATLASTLAQQLGLRLVDLSSEQVPLEVIRLVPQSLAERHNVFPIQYDPKSRESLTVAFSDPTNLAAIDEVRFQTGKTLRIVVAPEGQIAQAIRRFYAGEEPTLTDREAEPSGLFGSVNEFLAAPEEEELAELEPIPSDSQISLNIRDLGLVPQLMTQAPATPKTIASDPLSGFLQGAADRRLEYPRAQSPETGLPQAFRSSPFLGSPPVPPGPPGGVPPVLARGAAGAVVPEPGAGAEAGGRRRDSQDIFAQAVDLSKKTVEGFIPPQDLLRSQSSTSLPVAPSAFANPPEGTAGAVDAAQQNAAAPRWELREPSSVAIPAFSEPDLGGAPRGLEASPATPSASPAVLEAPMPVSLAASEARFAQALARLLIEKGLIQESELLAKLAEK